VGQVILKDLERKLRGWVWYIARQRARG
jgi:hypothetical protein